MTGRSRKACRRYPCDAAFSEKPHVPVDGQVTHWIHVDGSPDMGWEVWVRAVDEGPWRVALTFPGRFDGFVSIGAEIWSGLPVRGTPQLTEAASLENTIALSNAIAKAAGWTAGAFPQR